MRACQNPYPVIDGRRTNCNLAAFGAQANYPNTPQRGWQFSGFYQQFVLSSDVNLSLNL